MREENYQPERGNPWKGPDFRRIGQALIVVTNMVRKADKKIWLTAILVLLLDFGLVVMQENLIFEVMDISGFEANNLLTNSKIFGALFSGLPDITGKSLLSLVIGTCFVIVPCFLWYALLNGFSFKNANPVHRAAAALFITIYGFVVAAEVWMLKVRLTYKGPFEVDKAEDPALAILFGVLFALINAGIAYWTAHVYHSIKRRRPSHA